MGTNENLHKVVTGFAAVNARDFSGFINLLDEEYQFQLVLRPQMLLKTGTVSGPDSLRFYLGLMYQGFPDFHIDEVALRANGNMVYHEVVMRATHTKSIPLPNGVTIPATGQHVRIPVEVYHTFDAAGRYMSSTAHVDILDLIKQMGSRQGQY